jgi:signal peptidase II
VRRAHPALGLAVAVAVFVFDQAVKFAVTGPLGLTQIGDVREIVPVFALRFVDNRGVSLGLLHADSELMRWALVLLTGAIAAGVCVWMWRERGRVDQAALGAVLGGALGNILDRVRLGFVVDYADLHFDDWRPFLVFNLADAAITLGVLVLLVRALLSRDTKSHAEKLNA